MSHLIPRWSAASTVRAGSLVSLKNEASESASLTKSASNLGASGLGTGRRQEFPIPASVP